MTQFLDDKGSPYTFHHAKVYSAWETDEIISYELWRNVGLAIAAIFINTLLVLTNLQICMYVMCIVVITLTDIISFLHFRDITSDIISCINIVLSIVDYSVHIEGRHYYWACCLQ